MVFSFLHARRRRSTSKLQRAALAVIEALEQRQLLTTVVAGGTTSEAVSLDYSGNYSNHLHNGDHASVTVNNIPLHKWIEIITEVSLETGDDENVTADYNVTGNHGGTKSYHGTDTPIEDAFTFYGSYKDESSSITIDMTVGGLPEDDTEQNYWSGGSVRVDVYDIVESDPGCNCGGGKDNFGGKLPNNGGGTGNGGQVQPPNPKNGNFDISTGGIGHSLESSPLGTAVNTSNDPIFYNFGPFRNNTGGVTPRMPPGIPWLVHDRINHHIIEVRNGSNPQWFGDDSGSEDGEVAQEDFKFEDLVIHSNGEYTAMDQQGNTIRYSDFGGSFPTDESEDGGKFLGFTDVYGNTLTAEWGSTPGTLNQITWTDSSSALIRTYKYHYDDNHLAYIQVTDADDSPIGEADYTYYGSDDDNGNEGDLETVTVKDAGVDPGSLGTTMYRYYKDDDNGGFAGAPKFIVLPDGYSKLAATGADPLTADVTNYAAYHFAYDSDGRVIQQVAGGAAGDGNGLGTSTYTYATNLAAGEDYNIWNYKQIETEPDGNRIIIYSNYVGDKMLEIQQALDTTQTVSSIGYGTPNATTATVTTSTAHGYRSGDVVVISGASPDQYNGTFTITVPSGSTDTFTYTLPSDPGTDASGTMHVSRVSQQWGTFYKYDSNDQLHMTAQPSAVLLPANVTELEQYPDLLNSQSGNYQYLSDFTGRIDITDYYSDDGSSDEDTADGAKGRVEATSVQLGELAVNSPLRKVTSLSYSSPTATVTSTAHGFKNGQFVLISGATPSAYNGIFPITVVDANTFTYTGGAVGQVSGTITALAVKAPLQLSLTHYFKHGDGNENYVHPVADTTVYRTTDELGAVTTSGETTSYTYTWFEDNPLGMASMTTTKPIVTAGENGPGTADVEIDFYDTFGNVLWHKDADGYITYTVHDPATGAILKQIADVDTSQTGTFTNLPSEWVTPTGGGLHLTRTSLIDSFGRTTQLVDALDHSTYAVYDNPNLFMRLYTGWDSDTHTDTGPTQVTHEETGTGYTDTFTMTASPTYNGSDEPTGAEAISDLKSLSWSYTNSSGQVTKTARYFDLSFSPAAVSGISQSGGVATVTTSSNHGFSEGDRVLIAGANEAGYDGIFTIIALDGTYPDTKFEILVPSGTASSATGTITVARIYDSDVNSSTTEGVYHYTTTYGYDSMGRQNMVKAPTGTIQRTVYDALGRVSSVWIGTDDTGATDSNPAGSGGANNMVKVSENQYDNGGLGDSNLTKSTQYPDSNPLNARSTMMAYDWRDRLVAQKNAALIGEDTTTHRPITYFTYDNLDQVLTQQQYYGDGIMLGGDFTTGALDNSFSADGKDIVDIASGSVDQANGIAVQSDGKIVIVGTSGNDFAVLRYNVDGTLDDTFDGPGTPGNGKFKIDIGSSTTDAAYGVAIDDDGRILVAGVSANNFALVRLNPDGSLDTTFNTTGKVTTDIGSSTADTGRAIALQSDGKIIIVGTSANNVAVVRYNDDGSLDTSFNTTGKVTTDIGSSTTDDGRAVALQPDGKIIIAGTSNSNFTLARYNSDGSLDSTFDGDGKLTTDISCSSVDHAYAVSVQLDGRIVAAGDTSPDSGSTYNFALVRYTATGALDTTFNSTGKVTTGLCGAGAAHAYAVVLQPDGKIIAGGDSDSSPIFYMARYNIDGSLDSSFDGDGLLSTQFGSCPGFDHAYAMSLEPGGKLLATGASGNDFATARYTNDGVPDNAPSGLLRAKSTFSYDEQGRVYRSSVYSVNQTSGAVSSSSLNSNTWYDHRGNVVATYSPGGLVTKNTYDGAGRNTTNYQGDGGGDIGSVTSITHSGATATVITSSTNDYVTNDWVYISGATDPLYNGSFQIAVTDTTHFTYIMTGTPANNATGTITVTNWRDANNVTGDAILEQSETTYDANGNAILTTSRQRNHDESGTGALGSQNVTPYARVSTSAYAHDLADRPVASLDIGAIGGLATSAPSASQLIDTTRRTEPSDSFIGDILLITSGADAGQQRTITAFDGSTKKFTVASGFTSTPSTGDSYLVIAGSTVLGQATTSGSSTSLTDSNRSEANGSFVGWTLAITSGTGSGQRAKVTAFSSHVFTLGSTITAPDTSSTYVLIPEGSLTNYGYDSAGMVSDVRDPRGLDAKTLYDDAGRTTSSIQNYVDGTPSADTDQTIEYTYDGDDHVLTQKAVLPSSAFQTTQYVYGEATQSVTSITRSSTTATVTLSGHGYKVGETVTISGATPAGYNGNVVITAVTSTTFSYTVDSSLTTPATGTITSRRADDVYSNDILTMIKYPDTSTGSASSSTTDQKSFVVDRLGENKTMADQNGTVHTYAYDSMSRLASDAATTLGSGVNNSILRLTYLYEPLGNVYQATSYDAASGGNVKNQVQYTYNGLGQLITEYQAQSGAVNTGSSPKVQYTYTEMSGGANNSRLTKITYPNGRIVRYEYNSGVDSAISRVSFLADDSSGSVGTHLEEYSYLGLGTIVQENRPQPATKLTYISQSSGTGAAGDQYTGLDRFGRVIDQNWYKASAAIDEYQYGYDADSNVLWKENMRSSTNSELYGDQSSHFYDGLNRLQHFQRGSLATGHDSIQGSAGHSQDWTLDEVGNATSISTDGTPQSREFNSQNQIKKIGGVNKTGYDHDGNTTTDENSNALTYDAWNRLMSYGGSSETFTYDALGRRITSVVGSTTTHLYYSQTWQVLEERLNTSTSANTQYVWGLSYVDAMVLRDRDTDSNGSLEERLYAQQDANYNVTSLTDTSGTVQERYQYDPYGAVTILTGAWGARGSSSYSWVYLHQGGRYDGTTKLYTFRHRDYSATLQRWMQEDPMGYVDGMSLYSYELSGPVIGRDPIGLQDAAGSTGGSSRWPGDWGWDWAVWGNQNFIPRDTYAWMIYDHGLSAATYKPPSNDKANSNDVLIEFFNNVGPPIRRFGDHSFMTEVVKDHEVVNDLRENALAIARSGIQYTGIPIGSNKTNDFTNPVTDIAKMYLAANSDGKYGNKGFIGRFGVAHVTIVKVTPCKITLQFYLKNVTSSKSGGLQVQHPPKTQIWKWKEEHPFQPPQPPEPEDDHINPETGFPIGIGP